MKAKLGSGQRFAALQSELARRGATNPAGLAASIGRKKLGKAKFQQLSAAGARRAAKRRSAADTDNDGK